MTTENENNPSRRIDDKRPAVALEWEKPAAEAVQAPARATQWTILLTSAGHGLVHAYGQPFADVRAHQQCINVVDEAIVIELRERIAQLEAEATAKVLPKDEEAAAQPVAASAVGLEGLDAEGLPTLGKGAAFCVPDATDKPLFGKGWMFGPVEVGNAQMPLYTAEQVRQAQRDAVAADRLARQYQQPARASVDTVEFRTVLMLYNEGDLSERELIAHINAWGGVAEKT